MMKHRKRSYSPYKFNERGSGLRPRGNVQNYADIYADLQHLFVDDQFPAVDSSIYFSQKPDYPFEWKRPHEICSNPCFISDSISRFDVRQGALGDCWFLAAVANITMDEKLFAQMVPLDQSFDESYKGIFHFNFWQYGRWIQVVVDDLLPTYNNKLVFMHSEDKNEFWSALLEKAYAKLHGSYEALKGGHTSEAMEDFTGGIAETFQLNEEPQTMFKIMMKAYTRHSLMGCSIEPDPEVVESELENGLIRGHAYSVTKLCLVDIETPRCSGRIPMIRLRNPWGNEAEWNGAFSDGSPEWQYISDETRESLGLTFDSDGEFWMTFNDFLDNFQTVEICNLDPDSVLGEHSTCEREKGYECSTFEGSWVTGVTAGGCRNHLDTFVYNPQYILKLEDPDEDDEDDLCTLVVALMQKNRRAKRKLGLDCLTIGFIIYQVDIGDDFIHTTVLDRNFFKYNYCKARSKTFTNLREVTGRFRLAPGTYCIIPSTFDPNEDGDFLIRAFAEKPIEMKENEEEISNERQSLDISPTIPSGSEHDIKHLFEKMAGDDLEIDQFELKVIVDTIFKREFLFDGFSKDTVRAMIAMMDTDASGKLGLQEFRQLWWYLRIFKTAFKRCDVDENGMLCANELSSAIKSCGIHLTTRILNCLARRYGDKSGRIAIDDFILMCVRLQASMDTFYSESENGAILFDKSSWLLSQIRV